MCTHDNEGDCARCTHAIGMLPVWDAHHAAWRTFFLAFMPIYNFFYWVSS